MSTYKARIPSGEKYINNIEIDHIDRLDTAQFFDLNSPRNQEINNVLIQICKDVLIESYEKGGREAGAVIDTSTGKHALHKATQYGLVDFEEDKNSEYYKIYKGSSENSCITIHNHNTPYSFSAQDIVAMISDSKVVAIVVITCRGSIYMLDKECNKDYSNITNSIKSNYKTDYITPDTREIMIEQGLAERRITTWENIQ